MPRSAECGAFMMGVRAFIPFWGGAQGSAAVVMRHSGSPLSLAEPPLTITARESVCACSALLLRGWVLWCGLVLLGRGSGSGRDYHSCLLCS
jgi:hypothetical protein